MSPAPSPTTSSPSTPGSAAPASLPATGCSPGAATRSGWTSARCTATSFPGQLAATGSVAWKPQVAWKLQLQGDGLDPAADTRLAQYPGRITFAAATHGDLRNGNPYGEVDLTQLSGQLRGNPLAGSLRLELAGEQYGLPQLDLRSGSARLTAKGSFTKAAGNLDFQLAAPNLAEAVPGGAGALDAQGHLAGRWAAPRITAQATGSALAYQTYSAGSLNLKADVDLGANGPLAVDLRAANVGLSGQKFDTVTLTGQGTRGAHQLALSVRQAIDTASQQGGTLDLALAGGLRGTTAWSGEIRRLDFNTPKTGTWKLSGPAQLSAGGTQAALKGFCWTSGAARLCADGQWLKNGPWNASGNLAEVPFSLLTPLLPPDLKITGAVGGTFTGTGSPSGLVTANVELHPGPGDLRYPIKGGSTGDIHFNQGTVRVVAGAEGLTGHADLDFVNTGSLRADLRLPQYNKIGAPLQSQTLAGHVVANFTNLGLVEAFVPDVENTRGTLNADLILGGTVAKPAITGSAQLQGAQVDVPAYNLQVRQLQLTAKSSGTGPLQIQGSARSGSGSLTIGGGVSLDGAPSRITVDGKNFQVANTQELKVLASPSLVVALSGTRVDVTGDIRIPELTVDQEKTAKATVGVSKDVIILPPSSQVAKQPVKASRQLYARVRAVLGDKVTIKASGFSGDLTGSLLVIEEPNKATAAIGELEVKNGVYKAYGQDLTLDHGRLIFAGGPIDNPGLDLKAFRKATDGTIAGINIAGTLRAPQATLYSDPAMDESNALAYLLLGHPLGQSSPQEGNLLANAATSLGLKGGNMVAKKIASRFGLQEARLESTGGLQETSLIVGKYLSPRLYVNFGVGLFQPINSLRPSATSSAASGTSRHSRARRSAARGRRPASISSTRSSAAREGRPPSLPRPTAAPTSSRRRTRREPPGGRDRGGRVANRTAPWRAPSVPGGLRLLGCRRRRGAVDVSWSSMAPICSLDWVRNALAARVFFAAALAGSATTRPSDASSVTVSPSADAVLPSARSCSVMSNWKVRFSGPVWPWWRKAPNHEMVPTSVRVDGSPFFSTKTSKSVPGWVCAVTSRSTSSVVELVSASTLCSFGFGTGRSTLTRG